MRCPLCGKKLWSPVAVPRHIQEHMKEGSSFLAQYAEVEFVAPPVEKEAESDGP